MPLSLWLVVVAQAQLYIFRCVHVSQLPQFQVCGLEYCPEKRQVLIQVFKLCVAEWIFLDLEYLQASVAYEFVFLIPERERASTPQIH